MTTFRFVTLDVFTDTRFGGNPLAVFPDAEGLSGEQMQVLAKEFNLSETTFVLPPQDPANTARVRIFHPKDEMPFAGHPLIGTGWTLARRGMGVDGVLRLEVPAGIVTVRIDGDSATISAPQAFTRSFDLPAAALAESLGLAEADMVLDAHAPTFASVGNPYVIAQVTPDALSRALPDVSAFRRVEAAHPELAGRYAVYIYAREGDAVRARMFAPLHGTFEDPATGSAATPLAGLLLSLTGDEAGSWDIVQGVEMGRPSLLRAAASRTADGVRATVGGGCVPVFSGEIEL